MDASSMNLRDELRRSYQYGNKDISHNGIRKASLSEYLIQYIMPTIIGTCDETVRMVSGGLEEGVLHAYAT